MDIVWVVLISHYFQNYITLITTVFAVPKKALPFGAVCALAAQDGSKHEIRYALPHKGRFS